MRFVPKAAVCHTHPKHAPGVPKEEIQVRLLACDGPPQESKQGHKGQPYTTSDEVAVLFPLALLLASIFDTLVHKKISATLLVSVAFS